MGILTSLISSIDSKTKKIRSIGKLTLVFYENKASEIKKVDELVLGAYVWSNVSNESVFFWQ